MEDDHISFRFGHGDLEVIHARVQIGSSGQQTIMALVSSIPKHVPLSEFCTIIETVDDKIRHMQVVDHDIPPSDFYYAILVSFVSENDYQTFYESLNDLPFNDLEDDCCKISPIANCAFFPDPSSSSECCDSSPECCPVCLEPLTTVGTIGVLCRHRFHLQCLRKWKSNSNACPVCRHHMHPQIDQSHCERCESVATADDLWICLICGHVGCGRRVNGHAAQHFQETFHTYALDVCTRSVWDYAAENFVHRLILGDGKLVEVEGQDEESLAYSSRKSDLKLENVLDEYNYLLSSQLQEQCCIFKQQQKNMERNFQAACQRIDSDLVSLLSYQSAVQESIIQLQGVLEGNVEQIKNQQRMEAEKTVQLQDLRKLNEKLLADQDSVRNLLQSDQSSYNDVIRRRGEEIRSLTEQLNDMRFYVKTQHSIENNPLKDEITTGTITSADRPPPVEAPRKSNRRTRR